jgi:hypothetical protein
MARSIAIKFTDSDSDIVRSFTEVQIPLMADSLLVVPTPMVFNFWIDPPMGYDMNGIDAAHRYYQVRIMSIADSSGIRLEVPYTEPIQLVGAAAPGVIKEFQMVGVTTGAVPADPAGLKYYKTFTVAQSAPGLQTVRARVFTTPQDNPTTANPVGSNNLVAGNPYSFSVQVTDSLGNPVTVLYKHVVISSSSMATGPLHLFLQQPWA